MGHKSSDPRQINSQSPHTPETEDESWKTRPSIETAGDEGENARVAQERQIDENAPLRRDRRDSNDRR
jgi:hypothetical protein